ncbi:ester cyclase [Streptomyces sp. NBC_01304]|uniref:ester cyclase n=1 Tax=Streptomyces sp. NBC_01304 TaxID=2903818 RepID=UPI002E151451|nr:ester cyclase [Streptomyces sp. NBC_01304]
MSAPSCDPPPYTGGPEADAYPAIADRLADRLWNHGDLSAIDDHCGPHLRTHLPDVSEELGAAALEQAVLDRRRALPDTRYRTLDVLAEGDLVLLRAEYRGTHRGELAGLPPTGRAVCATETTLFRFEDGRVVELWQQSDGLAVMTQLGLIAPEETPPLGRIAHSLKATARLALLRVRAARSGGRR